MPPSVVHYLMSNILSNLTNPRSHVKKRNRGTARLHANGGKEVARGGKSTENVGKKKLGQILAVKR